MFNLLDTYSGNITLIDSSDNTIFEYNPSKKYQSIVISNSKLEVGKEYILYVD